MVFPQLSPPIEASNLMALRTSSDVRAYAKRPTTRHPTVSSSVFTVNSKPRAGPMTIPLTGVSICPWSCSIFVLPSNPTWSAPLPNLFTALPFGFLGFFFGQSQSLTEMNPTDYVQR
uniref:Retrovirus-related Pol polyprotein from transposon 412 n=1 Tax=Schistocephalus solidus TaxID=70667 RepID=A0A0X3P5U3_SCHSO